MLNSRLKDLCVRYSYILCHYKRLGSQKAKEGVGNNANL